MKLTTLKAVLLAAGMSCCAAALAAATLVQDVRVFDGKSVHERRSVLFDNGIIVDANYRAAAPAGARIVGAPVGRDRAQLSFGGNQQARCRQ